MKKKYTELHTAPTRIAVAAILTFVLLLSQNDMTRGDGSITIATAKDRTSVSIIRYRVTEIPLPYEVASGERLVINAAGDVVGTHERHATPNDRPVAFYYQKGTVTDIADKSDGSGETHAFALNNHGQILLGRSVMAEGGVRDPFLWEKGHLRSLGLMPRVIPDWRAPFLSGEKKAAFAVGSALNDAGEVAGYFVADIRGSYMPIFARTFLWSGDKVILPSRLLPMPNALVVNTVDMYNAAFMFVPAALNRKGELVGYDNGGGNGMYQSTVYVGKIEKMRTIEVGRKVDPDSTAITSEVLRPYAANNRGQWVGTHDDDLRTPRACVWSGEENAVRGLPDLPLVSIESAAYGINDKGLIVGMAQAPLAPGGTAERQAILWTGGKAVPLNDLIDAKLGIRLQEAHGINERGQIVAVGYPRNWTSRSGLRAYLLTPLKKN